MNLLFNNLKFYQSVNKKYEEKDTSPKAKTTKHKSPSLPTAKTSTTKDIVTLDLSALDDMEVVAKFFKDVDHNISKMRNYITGEWQVSGFTRRLRNGKYQYFPPSIRRRKSLNGDMSSKKNKTYVIKDYTEGK